MKIKTAKKDTSKKCILLINYKFSKDLVFLEKWYYCLLGNLDGFGQKRRYVRVDLFHRHT